MAAVRARLAERGLNIVEGGEVVQGSTPPPAPGHHRLVIDFPPETWAFVLETQAALGLTDPRNVVSAGLQALDEALESEDDRGTGYNTVAVASLIGEFVLLVILGLVVVYAPHRTGAAITALIGLAAVVGLAVWWRRRQ
ncbi:MAG: hypothetical protein Q8S13_00375 [Dehalococcoidia bacterium]|nr:hypothetical protein [Dehalococcoidia bacterium]